METKTQHHIIIFNTRDELIKIDLRHVAYFHADRNYTEVHYTNGNSVLLTTSMSNIEKTLAELQQRGHCPYFVRIGRSFIISNKHIFHIDVLRQKLSLNDPKHSTVYNLDVPKEALKQLKELYVRS